MTERERLIELCDNIITSCESSLCADCGHDKIDYPNCMAVHFADHILADGWIRPPCKVGDMVYYLHEICDENGEERLDISTGKCEGISIQKDGLWIYCRYEDGLTYWHKNDESVFFSREEAIKALKGGESE